MPIDSTRRTSPFPSYRPQAVIPLSANSGRGGFAPILVTQPRRLASRKQTSRHAAGLLKTFLIKLLAIVDFWKRREWVVTRPSTKLTLYARREQIPTSRQALQLMRTSFGEF